MMWVDAGFSPDEFWKQTPRSFQLTMKGVRQRLERQAEMTVRNSYDTGAFSGLAYHGKLKALTDYLPKKPQTREEMLATMRALANAVNSKFKKGD